MNEEKLYKVLKRSGGWNIALGVFTLVCGITTGILLIISGAKLLAGKGKLLF
ncbi:MAG: hypothetical protein IJ608_07175 [Lachnospiraceae bacterium]|nr:hypothetical protein [Lachnospiraceae bacterium]